MITREVKISRKNVQFLLSLLPPSFPVMRLWLLCEILLLLSLCAVTCVAVSGQTVAMRRAHQLRKFDRITHANDDLVGQILAQGSSSPPRSSVAGKCTLVRPRAMTTPARTKFCRPKSVSKTNGTTTQGSSKSSAHTFSLNGGKWLYTSMSLVALTFLYSF